MMVLTLDCGRKVSVDSVHYAWTYRSLLEGRPTPELNRRILDRALTQMEGVWGKRKVHLLPPPVNTTDPAHPVLPPVQLWAWLTGCPVRESFMASELVVAWFAGECENEPLAQVVFRAVRALPWDELAEDFDW